LTLEQVPVPGLETSLNKYDIWSLILDNSGRPHLGPARREFLPLRRENIPFLIEAFKFWQSYVEYLVIKDTKTNDIFAVKCSKRGNDIYQKRLEERLGFLRYAEEKEFFAVDFKGVLSKKVSPCLLWVTFTYDAKLCSRDEAWRKVMEDFNDSITKLRKHYGRIHYVMFPQPFPDPGGEAYGYPHIHCAMLFEDAEFGVFPNMEKINGKLTLVYRVQEKDEIKRYAGWHSFIDIKALRTGEHLLNYVFNYAKKVMYGDSDKASINNAILWLYRKKAFNVSGEFREKYSEFIRGFARLRPVQVDFEGKEVASGEDPRFRFLGIYGLDEIREFKKVKDPPGWVLKLDEDVVASMDKARELNCR